MKTKPKQKTDYPKVSIITCVYNGGKYISKLLDSVLNMGYPNIEHIIVNDGSTDSTEDIVLKYAQLYKNKEKFNLYIKYIKQENMGLGGATNTGLKQITGEFWTWINCDDWYEKEAFFEPIELLLKKTKIDYVQMNGYYYRSKTDKNIIVDTKNKLRFRNKRKLFAQFIEYSNFKYLLYICKTSSFRKINPTMQIYPSKYTQDEQLGSQLFPLLNGSFCEKAKWYFYQRNNNYQSIIGNELLKSTYDIRVKSVDFLDVKNRNKITIINILKEANMIENIKINAVKKNPSIVFLGIIDLLKVRARVQFSYWLFLDHKLLLYFIYSFLPFIPRNK